MKKFASLVDQFSNLEKSKVVIASAPYEGTVTYGSGTSKGPGAIINASDNLELYDLELGKNIVEEIGGIATLKPYNLPKDPKEVVRFLYNKTKELLEKGKFVVTLGGEHTVSIGPARAYSEHFKDLSILYFDAHADLRDEFEGNKYSHACALRRISEFNEKFVHVGCRSLCEEEIQLIKEKNYRFYTARDLKENLSLNEIVEEGLSKNVYISFDVDVFDASLMPATGTPEPGGLDWYDVLKILRTVSKKKQIVGFDVVELSPINGFHAYDFLASKLIYKTIGYSLIKK